MSPSNGIAILCLGCLVPTLRADDPKTKSIDAGTISAYEKIGAKYGGFFVDKTGFLLFGAGEKAAGLWTPGFGFTEELPGGKLPKLPPVDVPFGLIFVQSGLSDEGLKELKELKNLKFLNLTGTVVTNEGLKEMKNLKSLRALSLNGTRVTDEGMKELKELKNLASLNLNGTKVGDKGLKELKDLPDLKFLFLGSTKVTDAVVSELRHLENLQVLSLGSTEVTVAISTTKQLQELVLRSVLFAVHSL